MIIGRVIGTVVSTRKDEALVGFKLLVVETAGLGEESNPERFVAVDCLGAGIGEMVLVTRGSSARSNLPVDAPTDAAVVGIVDTVDLC